MLPSVSDFSKVYNVSDFNVTLEGMKRNIVSTSTGLADTQNVFFAIDVLYDDAFVHWHAESGVFLAYWNELLTLFPNIRILLDKDKIYKRLALSAYNVPSDRIIFGGAKILPIDNFCIFPPLFLLNDLNINIPVFSALWEKHILFLRGQAGPSDKVIEILMLPRQTRENYKPNDRTISGTQEFCAWLETQPKSLILHTDRLTSLIEQVSIVLSSKIIVLDYGSSFFVNGSLAQDSTIFVVNGTLADFPALRAQVVWMKDSGNRIFYVPTLADVLKR